MLQIRSLFIIAFLCALATIVNAQAPVPDFSASTVAGCGPLGVTFTDHSSNTPVYWTWDFGNGQISNKQNPSTSYNMPGTYTVTLLVRNADGANSITKTDYITVYAFPSANYSADHLTACAPANVTFTDASTPGQGSITSWSWNFGDGSGDNTPSPSHSFAATGYYNVSLTVVNSGGCSSTATRNRYIRVVQGVQPGFSWSQSSASCSAPFDINFINQTSGPGNLTYTWDLGNGNTSTAANPSTNYPANTAYPITLTATSDFGCSATTTRSVSFQGGTPVINAPDQVCLNTPVNFQNGSAPAPLSSSWDFGDGTTASVANPGKTYPTSGTYTVTLTNTYAACSSTATKNIQVVTNPTASFTADKTAACKTGLTVNFTDQTPGATGWSWDFGDGNTSTVQNPTHTYNALGNFTVSLTATTGTGCTAVASQPNFISIGAPTATIHNSPVQGCVSIPTRPEDVNVSADIDAPDGVATYAWSSPDASAAYNANTATVSFAYASQGYHNVSLSFTTNGGCTFSQTFTNAVLTGNPVIPDFTVNNASPCASQTAIFTATPGTAPVDHWLWLFGDGESATTPQTGMHKYRDTGYYTVKLQVFNSGCGVTTSKLAYIYINAPIAGFSYAINCGNRQSVKFTDTSITDPSKGTPTYKWDFGDPAHTTSTAANPAFIYPSLGIYNVTEIINQGGCADTITKQINLTDITTAFGLSSDSVCKGASFTLTSTSSPKSSIVSYSWKIGAGAYTTAADSMTYDTAITATGAYPVILQVIDSGGCPHTSPTQTLQVIGPKAQFTTAAGGCRNTLILFTDQSTPYNNNYPITAWTFDGGDGATPQTFTAPPFTHSYTDTGAYTVILKVTDTKGCSDIDTALTPVRITAPRAGFFAKDTLYCPNAPIPLSFIDSSAGTSLAYSWDFGDGTGTSSLQNPTHNYTTNGRYYNVKLKVTDDAGCADSVTRTSYIHIQAPIAAFTMQDSTSICIPLQTSFFPAGQYYDSLYWSFGDGTTSNLDTTTHFYNSYGAFKDTLFLKGAGGCVSDTFRTVNIFNPLTASQFAFSPVTGCDTVVADFTIKPPADTRFTLVFGDGTQDSSGNLSPTHSYNFPSSYVPQLGLLDSTGCIVGILATVGAPSQSITVKGAVPFFSMNQKKFCDQGTVFFTDIVINNDPPVNITWDFGDGNTTTGDNPSNTYITPGIYKVKLTANTNSGCKETYIDSLHVYQTPHPLISTSGLLCTGLVQFQGGLVTPEIDTVIWAWNFSDGQSSKDQNPLLDFKPGPLTAHLQASVSYGCSDTISHSQTIVPLPEIKGPSILTDPVNIPVTLPFTYSPNIATYTWSPATYLDCTDCANPVSTPVFATLYTVSVTDNNGCTSSDSVLIKTICNTENYFLPNTFSPNNDGSNDVFYPRGRGINNIQSMRIFNRWGQMVFERRNFPANSASEGWDGTVNSHPAPSDVYIYIVEVICENAQVIALKGDVTLVR